jgi:hypothetical protein
VQQRRVGVHPPGSQRRRRAMGQLHPPIPGPHPRRAQALITPSPCYKYVPQPAIPPHPLLFVSLLGGVLLLAPVSVPADQTVATVTGLN